MLLLYGSRERVLVTGGDGFPGSHLTDRPLEQGHEVLWIDNLFAGTKRNINHPDGNLRFEFLPHDVTFPLYAEVDEIYNGACPASPIRYRNDPVPTIRTLSHGATNMPGLANRLVARILQDPTSEVYGDPSVHPQPEQDRGHVDPIRHRSCYDQGKRCAETLSFDCHRRHGLEIKVVRILKAYGPQMHHADGRVVSNFIVQAQLAKPIMINGVGRQTRSFPAVDDLIDGFVRLMETPVPVTGPITIGKPEGFTILELAEEAIQLTGSATDRGYRAMPQDGPGQRRPDIAWARSLQVWHPAVAQENRLPRMISYFKGLLADSKSPPRAAS